MICSSSANDDCMHPLAQSVGAIVTTSAALVATDLPSFRFHVPTEMVQITVAHGALFALMDGSSVEDSSTLVLRNQLWQGISWGDLQNAFGARLEPPTDFPTLISVIECQSANSVETHCWLIWHARANLVASLYVRARSVRTDHVLLSMSTAD